MNKKWALLKGSDIGPMGRGQAGKKKVYEIVLDGFTLTCSWGMAEKTQRQTSVKTFSSTQAATVAAYDKLYSKLERGYEVAYEV
jgi:predicted DNA-binding WGR domain protein